MRRRKSRAQAMLEFAMLAPVFFLMFTAVVDFARAAWTYSVLANDLREGARNAILAQYGTSSSTDATVLAQVQKYAIGLSLSTATCVHGWNTAPTIHAPATDNTGWIYIMPGQSGGPNAPSGQTGSLAAPCLTHIPAGYGAYPLEIQIVYRFKPFTPFASQFFGSGGITMNVTSTMYTEF